MALLCSVDARIATRRRVLPRPGGRRLRLWVVVLTVLAFAPTANAGYSDACQTRFGICQIRPAPIGAPCYCYRDPGRVIPRPRLGISCHTRFGVCRLADPAPVNSRCDCYGDPGTVR